MPLFLFGYGALKMRPLLAQFPLAGCGRPGVAGTTKVGVSSSRRCRIDWPLVLLLAGGRRGRRLAQPRWRYSPSTVDVGAADLRGCHRLSQGLLPFDVVGLYWRYVCRQI